MLQLPTTPEAVLHWVIPGAADLLPPAMRSDRSDVELLAIGLQESGLGDRRQGTPSHPGPARGLLQFEQSGVRGVMEHRASRALARQVCASLGVPFDASTVHKRMEFDDVLCFAFGRLLLWTDPAPLPNVGDTAEGFAYYLRNWRPGAAKTPAGLAECRQRWAGGYPKAVVAVRHE